MEEHLTHGATQALWLDELDLHTSAISQLHVLSSLHYFNNMLKNRLHRSWLVLVRIHSIFSSTPPLGDDGVRVLVCTPVLDI